ncbi:MAG: hypothetical protein CVV58_02270 [Tenericutes bacterium HGW-Tenericutes-3]|nr:MAG: hypothetical protein CVV58_02270 [Tenericutes bacterium HGW-Tenericutes-3]
MHKEYSMEVLMSNYELKARAREQLKDRYWMVFVVVLIVLAVSGASYPLIVGLIVVGPLTVGLSYYLLDIVQTNHKGDNYELLIEGFKKSLVASIVSNLLTMIFIFLWSLLLIIPGIIKALSYSMTPYIIADNPEIDGMVAIDKSREMMRGNKTRLFFLYFSFIGWFILCLFTFGIGFFFLAPYIKTTVANFYVDIRGSKRVLVADFSKD